MKIVELRAENFKVLRAIEITPDGNVVEVGGPNGSGKSSVLDAIYVALVGRSAAPPRPIRTGEEECLIGLDLGELKITRKFTAKEDGQYTDSLKVENADGLRYGKPQEVLDALLGEIGFDPFEFVQMKSAEQADTLLRMVPLPVDLDELAEQDTSDYQKRRDINRDASGLAAQIGAIPKEEVPPDLPDRQALVDLLGDAANKNGAIERLRAEQSSEDRQAAALDGEIGELEGRLAAMKEKRGALTERISAREPLGELIDTDAIRRQLTEAEAVLAAAERQRRRAELTARHTELTGQSETLTAQMAEREKQRNEALAGAQMPIEGLAFGIDEKGKPMVQFGGVPFEQASTAEQLRASTAIAMAANPSLRVLRIKDGSLLDDDSMKLLADMAAGEDFQLFIERVGTGGVGIIMQDGMVVDGELAEPKAEKPRAKGSKAADKEKLL